MAKKLPVIRASEIGAYIYCRRAWWLRRVGGFEPEPGDSRFSKGIEAHVEHGRRLRKAQLQQRVALGLVGLGLTLLLMVGLFLAITAIQK